MSKTQKNNAEKEAKRLLEEKIASLPLDSESRLHVISDNMESALKLKEHKIAMLVKAIDDSFPPETPNRGFYEAFASLSFDTVYSLYLQNNNSALIVELQGILERSCLNSLEDLLPIDDIAKEIIIDVLSKKTLRDVAPYFVKYGIWDEKDKDFALELTKLRNGIAHKNAEIVSRSKLVKGSGQDRHYESIHSLMNKMDCTSFNARGTGQWHQMYDVWKKNLGNTLYLSIRMYHRRFMMGSCQWEQGDGYLFHRKTKSVIINS